MASEWWSSGAGHRQQEATCALSLSSTVSPDIPSLPLSASRRSSPPEQLLPREASSCKTQTPAIDECNIMVNAISHGAPRIFLQTGCKPMDNSSNIFSVTRGQPSQCSRKAGGISVELNNRAKNSDWKPALIIAIVRLCKKLLKICGGTCAPPHSQLRVPCLWLTDSHSTQNIISFWRCPSQLQSLGWFWGGKIRQNKIKEHKKSRH